MSRFSVKGARSVDSEESQFPCDARRDDGWTYEKQEREGIEEGRGRRMKEGERLWNEKRGALEPSLANLPLMFLRNTARYTIACFRL